MRILNALKLAATLFPATILLTGCPSDGGAGGGSGSDGGTTATTIPYMSNILQPTNLVCNGLNAATADSGNPSGGLVANLFYLDASQPRYSDVNSYINNGNKFQNATFYFNDVNVPTRPFDRGFFTNSGQLITAADGSALYEYFGFEMASDVVLGPNDSDGDYQFALLADDGAVLSFRGGDGLPSGTIVNDDGTHATEMTCASSAITMDHSSRLPINLRWYQGPRYHIALVVMWRPWPSDPALVNDTQCGKSGNSMYFDSTQNPPTPQVAYNGLLARGWKVLNTQNYKVPQGVENSCNVPAPALSTLVNTGSTQTTAEFTWFTDVPSTGQLKLTDSLGNVIYSAIDTLLVTSHDVTISGLTANTSYTAVGISASASGLSSQSQQLIIKTHR